MPKPKMKKYLVKWTYSTYETYEAASEAEALKMAENDDPPTSVNLEFEDVEVVQEQDDDEEGNVSLN